MRPLLKRPKDCLTCCIELLPGVSGIRWYALMNMTVDAMTCSKAFTLNFPMSMQSCKIAMPFN